MSVNAEKPGSPQPGERQPNDRQPQAAAARTSAAGIGLKQMIAVAIVLALGVTGSLAILTIEPGGAATHGDDDGHGHGSPAAKADGHAHGAAGDDGHADHDEHDGEDSQDRRGDEHAHGAEADGEHGHAHDADAGDVAGNIAGSVAGAATAEAQAGEPAEEHAHEHADGHADGHAGDHAEDGGHEHGAARAGAAGKGAHGGEVLSTGDLRLEVLLDEAGGEPKLKVWPSLRGMALPLDSLKLRAELRRPGGQVEQFAFAPGGDFLISQQAIAVPHVFTGKLTVGTARGEIQLPFSRREGVITMSAAQLKEAGIIVETASSSRIRTSLQLPGEIRLNEDLTAHVVPRVSGIVEAVPVALGDQVRKGQRLAVISSPAVSEQRAEFQAATKRLALARTVYQREQQLWREKISPEQDVQLAEQAMSEAEIAVNNARQKLQAMGADANRGQGPLNRFELRAPFDGTIVEKHIVLGEQLREDAAVFTISDLRSVWAQFNVPASELPQVRVGEQVRVRSTAFDQTVAGKVSYIGSLIGEQTRTAPGRVTLENPDGVWRPGLFISVELIADDSAAPITVAADAIQTIDKQQVVFVRTAGGFVAQPVQTGRRDGRRVEIVAGLSPGARYASSNSFVVKSEAGKASATHEH